VLTGHLLKDTAYAARYHESDARYANAVVRGADLESYLGGLLALQG